jgi:hypothetical protein
MPSATGANASFPPAVRARPAHVASGLIRPHRARKPGTLNTCTSAGNPFFRAFPAAGIAGGGASSVLGGIDNLACAEFTAIGAGDGNIISFGSPMSAGGDGDSSFIGGGVSNEITAATAAFIGAGFGNVAAGEVSFIGAGENNVASGSASFVGAGGSGAYPKVGKPNIASGPDAFVGAGDVNTASGQNAFVGAGNVNTASGDGAFVGGGGFDLAIDLTGAAANGNVASGTDSFVGSGDAGIVYGTGSFIGAGGTALAALVANTKTYVNVVSGVDAFVGGGDLNSVSGNGSFIGAGGYTSALNATANHVQTSNAITSNDSFIGAGDQNSVAASQGFIGGGQGNRILKGAGNATIAGGAGNVVSGSYVAVGGGVDNGASALFATIPGGYHNVAAGVASFAAGYLAEAMTSGSFAWSDQSSSTVHVRTTVPNEFAARAAGGVYFYSDPALTSGVRLAPGAGSWSNLSDRAMKTAVVRLDDAAVLAKVAALPVSEWSYSSERGVRHVGPMAQDFYAAFRVGEDDRHITSIDEDGVALSAIKALHAENTELGSENARMRADVLRIRTRLESVRANDGARLAALERTVASLSSAMGYRRTP